jgi:dihydroorotate dehydrogenase
VLYKFIFDVFFRRVDPEAAHHLGMFVIRLLGATSISSLLKVRSAQRVDAMGLKFDSVFGLAAGFDKNAHAVKALGDLGFSHVEIGTVTAIAQSGNDKPRLFRLIEDRALINRMGFNNDGAEKIAARLAKTRQRYGSNLPIIGINIGKSRVVEVDDAVDDYRKSARMLAGLADYLAVNVSSPNTPGLRSLQTVKALRPILEAVIDESLQKPVLVKIAPDLEDKEIVAVAKLAKELKLAGVIATNTTISRDGLKASATDVAAMGAGGLSGAPLKQRALQVLDLLRANLGSEFVIVSVGGVETAQDVRERVAHGANLVQGYTGFVYEGPLWARKIKKGMK